MKYFSVLIFLTWLCVTGCSEPKEAAVASFDENKPLVFNGVRTILLSEKKNGFEAILWGDDASQQIEVVRISDGSSILFEKLPNELTDGGQVWGQIREYFTEKVPRITSVFLAEEGLAQGLEVAFFFDGKWNVRPAMVNGPEDDAGDHMSYLLFWGEFADPIVVYGSPCYTQGHGWFVEKNGKKTNFSPEYEILLSASRAEELVKALAKEN